MARINIDDDFWVLTARLGAVLGDQHRATGMALSFKNLAQNKFKDGRVITKAEMQMYDFDLRMVGICAVEVESGYQWWNAEEEFNWLKKRAVSGKSGGIASGAARGRDFNDLQRSKTKQNEANSSKTNPLTLSLPLEENNNSFHELSPLAEKPRSGKETFSINDGAEFYSKLSQFKSGWLKLYSAEFCERELDKILLWLQANPKKNRKTLRGWHQFVSGWFDRGWDKSLTRGAPASSGAKAQGGDQWTIAAVKVAEALRRSGSWSKDEREIRAMLTDPIFDLCISAGVSRLRQLPAGDFYIRNIVGLLKEAQLKPRRAQ
jgi:hypothetical protein